MRIDWSPSEDQRAVTRRHSGRLDQRGIAFRGHAALLDRFERPARPRWHAVSSIAAASTGAPPNRKLRAVTIEHLLRSVRQRTADGSRRNPRLGWRVRAAMHRRPLTSGEVALARSVFGDAIDYARAAVANRKWIFFQPRAVAMAPLGCIHFHPQGGLYRDDFSVENRDLKGLFLHEMTHVWQHQQGIFLPLRRHPFCRYGYALHPGWRLERYGLEQQAEIVRHMFLLREGALLPGAPPLAQYRGIVPFTPQ